MTLYAVDQERKELYSKFLALDTVKEIRLPISSKSVAGFVAVSRQTVNIADAYDGSELKRVSPDLHFDASWDKRTGFRTTQILAMPILHEGKVFGVVQLLNKRHGSRFTKDDEASVARIAKTLGIAFNNQAQLGAQRRGTKFDYLISQGMVSQDEINQAIGQARQKNLDVETVLVEQFRVPKARDGNLAEPVLPHALRRVRRQDHSAAGPHEGPQAGVPQAEPVAADPARGQRDRRADRQSARSAARGRHPPAASRPEHRAGGRPAQGHQHVPGAGGRRALVQGQHRQHPERSRRRDPAREGRRQRRRTSTRTTARSSVWPTRSSSTRSRPGPRTFTSSPTARRRTR